MAALAKGGYYKDVFDPYGVLTGQEFVADPGVDAYLQSVHSGQWTEPALKQQFALEDPGASSSAFEDLYGKYRQPDGSFKTPGADWAAKQDEGGWQQLLASGLITGGTLGMLAGGLGVPGMSNATGGPASWFTGGADAPWGANLIPEGTSGTAVTGGTGGNMTLDELFKSFGDFGSTPVPADPNYIPGTASDWWSGGPLGTTTATSGGVPNADFGKAAEYWNGAPNQIFEQIASKVGPQAAKSLFDKVMSEGLTTDNIGKLVGALGPGALAAFGANQQQGALQDIANKARSDRAPFLDFSKGLLAGGPAGYAKTLGADSETSLAHQLSARFGTPGGSGTAMQLMTDAGVHNWQDAVSKFANLGLSGNTAALDTQAAQAGGGVYTGLADALGRTMTPQDDLASLFKRLQGFGFNLGTGTGLV